MAIVVANFFNNFKWGGAAKGSSGGQVTWSYAAVGATLADFNIGFEVTDPYFKEHIAYAFDVWESILDIDFKLVSDSADPSIRVGFAGIGEISPYWSLTTTFWDDRPGAMELSADSVIGIDSTIDWLRDPVVDPVGNLMAENMISAVAYLLGLKAAPDANSVYDTPALRPSAGDITVLKAYYGASGYDLGANNGNNRILLNFDNNVAFGLAGRDWIAGYGGNDTLYGGADDDRIDGGSGNDKVLGGTGNDYLLGGIGFDTVNGNEGNDTLFGGFGQDKIIGGQGYDTLNGGFGNDKLYGDGGNDILNGDSQNDYLYGSYGADRRAGGVGLDNLTGGAGFDTFIFALGDEEDWIMDFENGIDKIDLSSFNFTDFTEVDAIASFPLGNTVLNFGDGDQLRLIGFDIANLDAGDFIL